MNTTDVAGFKKMLKAPRPLKFIPLTKLLLGSFRINYHLDEEYDVPDLSHVWVKEQLLFQKFVSRNQQLNLMMVDSLFPQVFAEVATTVLIRGPQTLKAIASDANSTYDAYLMSHKMKQFANHLLYSNIADDLPFNGQFDYEKVYYRLNSDKTIGYYSVYEQHELTSLVFNEAVLSLNFMDSVLNGREILLKLDVTLN